MVKKYKFLFKPLFFIFSLLFSSWMVLVIEKISPSDFGRYESLFKTAADTSIVTSSMKGPINKTPAKKYFKKLCIDYRSGVIDSVKLEQELEKMFSIQ